MTIRRSTRFATAGVFAVCMLAATACDRGGGAAAADTRGEPDATYIVRGRVESVPVAGKPTTEFMVHHEPIPTFVNFNGTIGMDSMSMPFPLAKGVKLDGIAPGDIVEVTFVVWTTPGKRGFEARKVVELPPDTALDFGKTK